MVPEASSVGLVALIVVLTYTFYHRITRPSLTMIRGPPSPSFLFGNLVQAFARPVGEADFAWTSLYGNVVRFLGVLGKEHLLVSDPKALQRILNTEAYSYPLPQTYRAIFRLWNGQGIFSTTGSDHARHKRIMLPGFGQRATNEFLPVFRECAEQLSLKWLEEVQNADGQTIDVLSWISRAALDVIGQAAFDVKFDCLQNNSHHLAKKYNNFLCDLFGLPSPIEVFTQWAMLYVPRYILDWIAGHSRHPRFSRARDLRETVIATTKKIIQEKAHALLEGKDNRDILSLLVKANMDENAKNRLTDDELHAEMSVILMAGHETTGNSLSWILLELAKNPKMQSRLRNEIRETEAKIRASDDPTLRVTDLNGMPYLNAVLKEGLRYHSVAFHIQRIVEQDDVLPLSQPVLSASGKMIKEIHVPKGTPITISVAAFNRDKDFWGEDAHEFNPERWLDGRMDGKQSLGVGIHSNLLTFASGPRACPGWRFVILEAQTFLFELVGKYEFGMTEKAARILRQPMLVMSPMVDGELDCGIQMPLTVSVAPRDAD